MAAKLEAVVREHAQDLVGLQEAQDMLDGLSRSAPALVQHVVPHPVDLKLLSEVLRKLAAEGVSIRPLRQILESLALHAPSESDPARLADISTAQVTDCDCLDGAEPPCAR